jgi:hypothetical protein
MMGRGCGGGGTKFIDREEGRVIPYRLSYLSIYASHPFLNFYVIGCLSKVGELTKTLELIRSII